MPSGGGAGGGVAVARGTGGTEGALGGGTLASEVGLEGGGFEPGLFVHASSSKPEIVAMAELDRCGGCTGDVAAGLLVRTSGEPERLICSDAVPMASKSTVDGGKLLLG